MAVAEEDRHLRGEPAQIVKRWRWAWIAKLDAAFCATAKEPPEELEPRSKVVPDPRQCVQHDGVHGIEEQVVVGWGVHALSVPRPVAGVAAHLWRERAEIETPARAGVVVLRCLLASRSLEADVPPVVELGGYDVVLEVDQAFRSLEVPCAARKRATCLNIVSLPLDWIGILGSLGGLGPASTQVRYAARFAGAWKVQTACPNRADSRFHRSPHGLLLVRRGTVHGVT